MTVSHMRIVKHRMIQAKTIVKTSYLKLKKNMSMQSQEKAGSQDGEKREPLSSTLYDFWPCH